MTQTFLNLAVLMGSSTSRPADICQNYHGGNEFSVKANKKTNKVKDKQLILEALARHPQGLTCERLEDLTFLKHQTCSSRIADLRHRDKSIFISGHGQTRSGCLAAIYRLIRQENALQRPTDAANGTL